MLLRRSVAYIKVALFNVNIIIHKGIEKRKNSYLDNVISELNDEWMM